MASKTVIDRQKAAELVLAAGRTHGEKVSTLLGGQLKGLLQKGEKLPDAGLLLSLACRALEQARDAMVEADAAHERELSDDEAPRLARDEQTATLREAICDLRDIIVGVYGSKALGTINLTTDTPREPVPLLRLAREVKQGLQTPQLGKPRVRGASLDTKEWSQHLSTLISALEKSLADVARETREAETTITAKARAIEAYDLAFYRACTLLSATLAMIGEDELAARVRPSKRRPGRTAEEPEVTEPPTVPDVSPAQS